MSRNFVGKNHKIVENDHSKQRGAKKKAVRSIKKTAAALIAESSNEDENENASDSDASVSSGSESNGHESASSNESNTPDLVERKRTRSQMGISKPNSSILRSLRPRSVKVEESGNDYVWANEENDSDDYDEDEENEDFQVNKRLNRRVSSTSSLEVRRGRPRKNTTITTTPKNLQDNLPSAPTGVDSSIVQNTIDADDGSDVSLQSVSDIEQNNKGYNDNADEAVLPSEDINANISHEVSTACRGSLPSHTLLSGIHEESASD